MLRFFQGRGGWVSLPPELAGIRQSLKIESYVLLYDDPRRIGTCFALAFMAPQELKTWGEEFDAMTHEDQEKQLQEFSSGLEEIGVALEKVFDISPAEQARLEARKAFDALSDDEKLFNQLESQVTAREEAISAGDFAKKLHHHHH